MAKKKSITPEKKECNRQKAKHRRLMKILICLATLTTICAVLLAAKVVSHEADLAESMRELAELPQLPETSELEWATTGESLSKAR